jgi:iron complex outermembrane recepter protein
MLHYTSPKIIVTLCLCIRMLGLTAQTKVTEPVADTSSLPAKHTTLEPIEVIALRATSRAPFAKTDVSRKNIEQQNLGQDLPFLLQQTPSAVTTSDAGNGVGYTALRIRGTDATRINFTINGVPYNDAESQGVFLVNLPDIASSINSLQIQRGVGTSSNGPGAFGASVNISTHQINEKPYLEINNSLGSFNTQKHTIKAGSGLQWKHLMVDGRLSYIASDGYIDKASSRLGSFYVGAAYLLPKSSIRFNVFAGKEKTYQAWNGIPEYKLFFDQEKLRTHYYNNIGTYYFTPADSINLFNSNHRTYNGFTYPNQTDNYWQTHYQSFFTHQINKYWVMNVAAYITKGKGYYEEYKNNASLSSYGLPAITTGSQIIKRSDLIRQLWLNNTLIGSNANFIYKTTKQQLTLGGGISEYKGIHFGEVVWTQVGLPANKYTWYHFNALKKEAHAYTKYEYNLSTKLQVLADVQYRSVNYSFTGTRKFPALSIQQKFQFVNPKVGLAYLHNGINWYASYAIAQKEPNRTDYEQGTAYQLPQKEQLYDWEAGAEKNNTRYSWGVHLYYMKYKNQLVLTGKINEVGDAIRINTPLSFRTGVELEGKYKLNKIVQLSGNASFGQNKIIGFVDYTPRYNANFELTQQDSTYFASTHLAFSPAIVASTLIQVFPISNAEIAIASKYVSKQFLDNTSSNSKSIKPYLVHDIRFLYTLQTKLAKQVSLVLQLNNIFNLRYESNGYTYSYIYDNSLVKENFYYPMAGRNTMAAINIRW